VSNPNRRCLIIEHHAWETGAFKHQLQFPLPACRAFFGPDGTDLDISVRIFLLPQADEPAFERDVTISRRYPNSSTRRTNRLPFLGSIPSSFLFFEETGRSRVYDLWWSVDKAIVAAHFHPWQQARSSQHGRGRLVKIVPAPVPRIITRVAD